MKGFLMKVLWALLVGMLYAYFFVPPSPSWEEAAAVIGVAAAVTVRGIKLAGLFENASTKPRDVAIEFVASSIYVAAVAFTLELAQIAVTDSSLTRGLFLGMILLAVVLR